MNQTEEYPQRLSNIIKYGKIEIIEQNSVLHPSLPFQLPSNQQVSQTSTEDILNTILPPLQFKNDKNQPCLQYVLTTPAKTSDLYDLQTLLDNALQNESARETGICPIRERLYSEFFDELIRQITINCSHRGILLYRIRNELKAEIEIYQKLYVSSLAYGIRASIGGQNEELTLQQKTQKSQTDISLLKTEIEEIKASLASVHADYEEEKQTEEDLVSQQIEELRAEHVHLKEKLKGVLGITII